MAIEERPLPVSFSDVQRDRRTGSVELLDRADAASREWAIEQSGNPSDKLDGSLVDVESVVIEVHSDLSSSWRFRCSI